MQHRETVDRLKKADEFINLFSDKVFNLFMILKLPDGMTLRHKFDDMYKTYDQLKKQALKMGESNGRVVGEDRFYGLDDIRSALAKVHDVLGANYTTLGEVIDTLEDMRVDFRPTTRELAVVEVFKRRTEDLSREMNPVDFWAFKSKDCSTVIEAVRLYLEVNQRQYPGASIIKNRILFLANKGHWK